MDPRAAVPIAVALAAGCTDPVIAVEVRLPVEPRAYADELATLTIGVHAAEDPEVTCDAVAFGLIDDDALALAEVAGVTLRPADGTAAVLDGVPRLGRKLWVVTGADAGGAAVIAGCAELGDVDGDVTVVIDAEPTAELIVIDPPRPEDPPPAALTVRVDDGLAVPAVLADRAVTWEVFGPAGQRVAAAAPAVTDGDGRARLEVTADTLAGYGPVSIQLRARWGRTSPVPVATFRSAPPVAIDVVRACTGGIAGDWAVDTASWQAFDVGGLAAVAGLARDGDRAHLFVAAWDGAVAVDACSAELSGVDAYTVVRGGAAAPPRLIVVTQTEWQATSVSVAGEALALTPLAPRPIALAAPPVAIVTMRACGREAGDLDYVLVQTSDDRVAAFEPDGDPIPAHPFAAALTEALADVVGVTPRLAETGCISPIADAPTPPLRAVILAVPRVDTTTSTTGRFLAIEVAADSYGGATVPSFGAVAFSSVALDEPVLLGGVFDPSGAKVVRWRLTPGPDALELREVARDDSLGPPTSIAYAHLDGDDALDTIWGLVDAVQGGVAESRLQVSLGAGAGELALAGVSPPVRAQGGAIVATGAPAVFLAPELDDTADVAIGTSRAVWFLDTDLE